MKDKRKKILKKFAPVAITMTITATILAGCNQNGGQTNKPVDPIDPKPPITQTEISVAEVLADVERYNNFDFMSSLSDVAVNVVEKNVEDEEATPLSFAIENDNFVVVAENENGSFTSVTLPLSEQCKNYVKNNTTKQNLVLRTAGLLASDMIKESEKDATIKKITDAIEEIETNVAGINDAQPSQINDYVAEGEEVNLSKLFEDKRSIAYIREDNSVVAFVFDEDKCKMTMKHFVVEGAENMTNAEIVAEIINGTATTASTNLRFDEDYTLPPLQKPIVETITVGEIFDQNFANLSFDADIEAAFQKLYNTGYKNATGTTLFYNLDTDKSQLRIFFNLYRSEMNSLVEIYMTTPEILLDLEHGVKSTILNKALLDQNARVEKDNQTSILNQINETIINISLEIQEFANLTAKEIKTNSYGRNSTEVMNSFDYAKKLFPGKEIVAAYVGDMSARDYDSQNFGTGYMCGFDIAVCYMEGDDISIFKSKILVPWYTNSTNQTLYESFLKGTEGQTYKLQNSETIIVSKPTIMKEQNAGAVSYNISLPVDVIGDVGKTYEMVDAVSQTFAK